MSKKEILMQPNNIIKGKYTCTALENKLFYKILFNAQKQNKDSSKYTCILTKDDFKDVFKNNNDLTQKNINDMLITLHQTILEFDYIDKDTKGLITYKSGLIGESKYIHDGDIYEINLHEILYKHITDFLQMQQIGNGYTPLNLELLFRFKGAYTQRLYTFFRLWSREKKIVEVKYTLENLRYYLKLESDMYTEYKVFKQKLLKRALKEINEKGNMKVEIKEEIRKNRKVNEIVFLVKDNETRKYFGEKLDAKECIKTPELTEIAVTSEIVVTNEIIDFYVPNKKLFTQKTLSDFMKDFCTYDFNDVNYKKALQESILITLEQDNEEKIKAKAYNYFKKTLNNKLAKANSASNKAIPSVKTRFHNINQSFNKYSPEELEKMLLESQRDKFK